MNPTLSKEIYEGFLEYISNNIVAFLIYNPLLGLAEAQDSAQYLRKYNLTMQEAVGYEISIRGGYSRYVFSDLTPIYREAIGYLILEPEWASVGEPMSPFTHVCVATNANTFNTNISNGNNRGDYQGTLVLTYPCNAPTPGGIILTPPTKFRCRIPIKLIGREL